MGCFPMLYSGVGPTVRQCGLSAELVQELVRERLIHGGDQKSDNDPDRYVMGEILPAERSYLSQPYAFRERRLDEPAMSDARRN